METIKSGIVNKVNQIAPLCPKSRQTLLENRCQEPCQAGYVPFDLRCILDAECPGGPSFQDSSLDLCIKQTIQIQKVPKLNSGWCPEGTTDKSDTIFDGDPCFLPCPNGQEALDDSLCQAQCPTNYSDDAEQCQKPFVSRESTVPLCPVGQTFTGAQGCVAMDASVLSQVQVTSNGSSGTTSVQWAILALVIVCAVALVLLVLSPWMEPEAKVALPQEITSQQPHSNTLSQKLQPNKFMSHRFASQFPTVRRGLQKLQT